MNVIDGARSCPPSVVATEMRKRRPWVPAFPLVSLCRSACGIARSASGACAAPVYTLVCSSLPAGNRVTSSTRTPMEGTGRRHSSPENQSLARLRCVTCTTVRVTPVVLLLAPCTLPCLLRFEEKLSMNSRRPYVHRCCAFFSARGTHSFFRVPYEVVKQRLQVGAYPNTMVALQSIYQQVNAVMSTACRVSRVFGWWLQTV